MLLPLRALLRARPFALAVVAMLGMGVGALVAAFGVIDAALWRQPPFPDARRLTILYSGRSSPRESLRWERWSFPRLQLLRQAATDFARVANYSPATLTLTGTQDPEHVSGEIVAPDYFPLLGVAALRGRTFAPDEDAAPGAHPIAVLSFDLWQRRFAGDTAVIGRTVGVNGAQLTVVGILPRGFRGLTDRAELWIPTAMAPNLTYADYLTTNQNFISLVARLRDEVPLERAARDLRVLAARINRALPPQDADSAETFTGTVVPVNQARVDPTTRRSLLVLLAGVVLLHLLACDNAINLLLGRAAARRRETAVRAALGGTATRLLRHALAEGFLLAAAGGALGLLLAVAASKLANVPANVWFARNFYGSLGTFDTPAVSARTMAVGLLLTLITALAVALAPAATMVRLDLGTALRAESRSSTGGSGSLRRPSARGVVVALEAALGMLLVVTAGLMIDSFARMRHANLGVVPDHVLTFWLRPPDVKVPPADAPRFISNVLDAITRVPGVLAATVDGGAPLSGSARSTLYVMGRPAPPRPEDAPPVDRHYVAPDHFRVLSIPLRRGRAFTDADDARHPRVAIISETAARRFWPAADPIGQRVWFGGGSNFDRPDSSAEIVGIVGDVADEPLDAPSNRASFYTPYRQFTYASRVVFVRTADGRRDPKGRALG